MYYKNIKFVTSVFDLAQLPEDAGCEVAFIGRSNAGKSSAINAITGIKGLAKTSKAPGRTQAINFFEVSQHKYLVDLPGYGFARVKRDVKFRWQQTIQQYLANRTGLQGVVQLMDIRHPLKDLDFDVLSWIHQIHLPLHVLLTKADKLKRGPANSVLFSIRDKLKEFDNITIQLFSVKQTESIENLRNTIDTWIEYNKN